MVGLDYLNILTEGELKRYTMVVMRDFAINSQKKWGQNFVIKKQVIDALLSHAHVKSTDTVVEVGGGLGTLTYFLLQECHDVILYEIDPFLVNILIKLFFSYNNHLKLIAKDFLTEIIPPHQKIIANLPYSISSPFIRKVSDMESPPEIIAITVQNEFANHLCAQPGDSAYSRISVFSSFFYQFDTHESFSASAFHPRPKVQSSIVVGLRRKEYPPEVRDPTFFPFLTNLFCRKHRKVKNNLAVYRKQIPPTNRSAFKREITKLDYSSTQSINLSPRQILDLYLQFREITATFAVSPH